MRTKGSKNIQPFGQRATVPTSSSSDIRHLASIGGNPLNQFSGLLNHQANFLIWIDERHNTIVTLKKENLQLNKAFSGKGPKGGKEGTFRKYRWYSEHLVLLEAINAFETFYKSTFTGLGVILQPFVPPSADRKISIDAQLLWGITGETLLPALIPNLVFEQQLFHDLDEVDRATDMLVGARRYNRKQNGNPLADRVREIRGIFQIRHTLSHNCGKVTLGDQSKFRDLNLTLTQDEVIDPSKDSLTIAFFEELENEANDFTEWLRHATAQFLGDCIANRNLSVTIQNRSKLEDLLGTDAIWSTINWTP